MGYTYTRIDGERVEVHVAAAFQKMEAAFRKKFGFGLKVASGTRTRAEQAALRARYVQYRDHGGPWAPLAAAPGYSNHEETGPRGPRALDIWDDGRDAGVTTAGTTRANWLKKNGPKYGFNPAGYGFSRVEPWHYEFTGSLTGAVPASTTSEEDEMNAAQEKKFDALVAKVDKIDRRVHKMTGKNLAYGIWGHSKLGRKVEAIYESVRYGQAGVRTHGKLTNDLLTRNGRQELQNEALLAAVKTLADSKGADGEAIVQAVAKSVDKALADVSITLSTEKG